MSIPILALSLSEELSLLNMDGTVVQGFMEKIGKGT